LIVESVATSVALTFHCLTPELRTPELDAKIQVFKEKYFGAGGGPRFWDWKYRQGPIDSRDFVVFALSSEGEIAGHLAAVVFPAVPGSRLPLLALGTEFIVDEKFRGGKHDVIRHLDSLLGENLAGKGVEMMFANPNKRGYAVSRRFYGRVDGPKSVCLSKIFSPAVAVPGRFRKPVHALLGLFMRTRRRLPAGWTWSRIETFAAADIDGFCREFARRLDYGIYRNAAFLNWRYGGGDGIRYDKILLADHGKVIGIAVLKINRKRCVGASLMECMALDDIGHDALLSICGRFAGGSAPALSALVIRDSPLFEACRRSGFRRNADILEGIRRMIAWAPAKLRVRLTALAENRFDSDGQCTLFFYPDPKRSKEFIPGLWYHSLGEKLGF
jgi:hypothetical protein